MRKMLKQFQKNKVTFLLIITMMSILVFANIGNRYMFIDEAIEAMLGKNILDFGIPKAWDGKNLIMAEVNGNEFNEELIYVRKNWFSNYIAAFGQLLSRFLELSKDESVTLMRSFFALMGVISAIALYYLVKEMTDRERIPNITLAFYAFSVNLLLYIRSIYYLSPTLLFTNLTILFYTKFVRTKSSKSMVCFTVSAILLFHSFYPYFLITMMSILTIFIFFDFDKQMLKEKMLRKIIISLFLILMATVPWYIYARSFLATVEKGQFTSFSLFIESLLGYLWQIHAYFFPFISIGIIYFSILISKGRKAINKNITLKTRGVTSLSNGKKKYRGIVFSGLQVVFNLLVISSTTNFLDTRRLIGAIPFLFYFMAVAIDFFIENKKIIGYAVLALCLFTNILYISPYLICKIANIESSKIDNFIKPPVPYFNVDQNWLNKKTDLGSYINNCNISSSLQHYLEEICNNYDDADKGIIKFLNKYANSSQKIMVVGYQYETIAYYTDCRVVNRLDADKDPLPSVFQHYPNAKRYEYLTYCPIMECDWIIERRSDSGQNSSIDIQNSIWHMESLFERYYIDYPDSKPWNEIWDHSFVTDDSYEGVYIYRNKLTTNNIDLPFNTFYRE